MWIQMVTSKYAHSRVPSLKQHYKQNLDITKAIFPEKYLPSHMRVGIIRRIIRFLFVPITLFAVLVAFDFNNDERTIHNICDRRKTCRSRCQADNFPNFTCDSVDYTLNYAGNYYDTFYLYSHSNSEFYTS